MPSTADLIVARKAHRRRSRPPLVRLRSRRFRPGAVFLRRCTPMISKGRPRLGVWCFSSLQQHSNRGHRDPSHDHPCQSFDDEDIEVSRLVQTFAARDYCQHRELNKYPLSAPASSPTRLCLSIPKRWSCKAVAAKWAPASPPTACKIRFVMVHSIESFDRFQSLVRNAST